MAGKFSLRKFSDINLADRFFDSLKADYPGTDSSPGFVTWFNKKAGEGRTALVFDDEEGLGAFISLKAEIEEIELQSGNLPVKQRTKISTLRIAERYRGQRLGEGAIGLVLWKWQQLGHEEIYVTVYPSHNDLIGQLEKFGFTFAGYNPNGECVYMRSRKAVDYSDPYKPFPFIKPDFLKAGYLLINDYYHDTLFPYSELKNTLQTGVALKVTNGLSKIYVGAQYTPPHYNPGEPILIYRIHNGSGTKRYKTCLTSFCVVTDVIQAKQNYRIMLPFDDLLKRIGNKSVYDSQELKTKYDNDKNVVIIEMLYYGYFGEGHNINMDWLDSNGLWSSSTYPALIQLSPDQFKHILREGNIDVDNVIVN